MRKIIIYIVLSVFAFSQCDDNADRLALSYDNIEYCQDNHIIWSDGSKMLYDDGKKKNFKELLNNPDIEDMFHYRYRKGQNSYGVPQKNYDPGRIRNDAFMKKMYGSSAGSVGNNLVAISWMPHSTNKKISVTRVNGVDKKLSAISRELDNLPPDLKKYVTTTAGTFNWRKISGTSRLSGHSFGMAIDINVKYSNYWKWNKGTYKYRNQIPQEIVEIFEKHGFIWGGKWYHYDTMHFEYRPEMLR